jgi:phosphoribosylanthranilate isomerase
MNANRSPVRVKICGITNFGDALAAIEAGADMLGFIFYQESPRYVPPEQAKSIIINIRSRALRAGAPGPSVPPAKAHQVGVPRFVGVFVNESARRLCGIMDTVGLDYAQLHGSEPPVTLEQIGGRAFKALRPTSAEEALADAEWYGDLGPKDGPQLLIDAFDPAAFGGTGKKADWYVAARLARSYRLLLAGGLTPDNVAQAVQIVRPWGVDVSSGVEIEPGRKDHDAIRRFVAAAKSVQERAETQ